ncbi:MAG: prephenate dehydratase [Candidatus Omnitrophica bacterium]|nr:prephenate dehydratase [Candidatus Omnitrophota bacterium]
MPTLKALRRRIDQLDRRLVALLNDRAAVAAAVGRLKLTGGQGTTFSPDREQAVYANAMAASRGPLSKEALRAIFREVMSSSLGAVVAPTIAYQGPPMSFAHLAARRKFGSQVTYVPCATIGDVYGDVERRRADYGVVPIENSLEGTVGYTLDRLVETELVISSEILQPIDHHAVGACPLAKVKRLYLHPQAHAQCRAWIEAHLPAAKLVETLSTSMAAAMAHNHPTDSAAIASEEAARRYGLSFLARSVGDSSRNVTRFLVVGRTVARPTAHDKTSLVFSIKDRVGALHDMLAPFRRYRINLTKIESRPSRRKAWDYYFFVDLEGHAQTAAVAKAIAALEERCTFLKVLGSYPASA